jgi:hypothetical protein
VSSVTDVALVQDVPAASVLAAGRPGWVRTQLERLDDLGIVTTAGKTVTLTSAGVPVSISLVEAAGVEVLHGIWRLDHPRLPDVLQVVGAHHPVKAVAKAAARPWSSTAAAWPAQRGVEARQGRVYAGAKPASRASSAAWSGPTKGG